MEEIVLHSIRLEYSTLKGTFRKSEKNMYASKYFINNNFIRVSADNDIENYELIIANYIIDTNKNLFSRIVPNDK